MTGNDETHLSAKNFLMYNERTCHSSYFQFWVILQINHGKILGK